MNETQSLEALGNIYSELAKKPYDVSLHIKHINLAQSAQGMEMEFQAAQEMMTEFLAAGDDVWLPLIRAKENSVDPNAAEDVEELLNMYTRAESDYLSIPLLQQHLQYLIDRHTAYLGDEAKPTTLGGLFSTDWTRQAIDEVVNKGTRHLTQGHLLWDAQRDWEMEMLELAPKSKVEDLIERVQILHLDRLRQPHSNSDETATSYSSFTTKYKPPQEYESLLVAASKLRAQGTKAYDRREKNENALRQTSYALDTYAQYIAAERRAKYPDGFNMQGIYERAIAEAAKRRFNGELGAEEALRSFWVGYCDSLRILGTGVEVQSKIFQRAVRSAPASGELWARYIRLLERSDSEGDAFQLQESVADLFAKALNMNLLQSDVEELVPFILARAGYERRRIELDQNEEGLPTLIGVLESGLEMLHKASKTGDSKLRLEKYLSVVYQEAGLLDNAIAVWQSAASHYKSSFLVWTNFIDLLIKVERYDQARVIFEEIHTKQLDWPEAIWEAWISFEHLHGSVDEIDICLDKVEKAQIQTNFRRAKEAEKAAYQSMQIAAEAQANVPVIEAPLPEINDDSTMDVDSHGPNERGKKRSAEDESAQDSHKKARFEQKPPQLKRDRENSTVFVADLPIGVTEDDLKNLFKDCGRVREVKITHLTTAIVATVEFFDRDSVPAALTKDKKRVKDQEVAVHLAWKSTMYITNFPESTDDDAIRELFGQYGIIFDVRWPSKKFKNTRRFCYVQFISPAAADKALELHGHELGPNLPLNVYISNPERKKDRTDQDANEREIYVAGLSKFTKQADLEKLFATYGKVKEVRMAEEDGHAKGFAFIEFEDGKDAHAALSANNHELKKRRIAVTLSDPRVRARYRTDNTGMSRLGEARSRSVRIRNLPPATQEGLLQQAMEKIAPVRRVEVFVDKQEAVVELENAAEAGKLLLRVEPLVFNGNTLQISEEGRDDAPARTAAPIPKAGGLFVPRRAAASRPRAGLGHTRAAAVMGPPTSSASSSGTKETSTKATSKGQDDFRKLLG